MLETVVHALFIILATLGVVAGIVVVVVVVAAAVLLYIAVSWRDSGSH